MSQSLSRRKFSVRSTLALGAMTAATLAPFAVLGLARPRLVVIGGGPGGATIARVAAQSGALDVTLVEKNRFYTTCFFSNLYLAGLRSLASLTHGYDILAQKNAIRIVHAQAERIDTRNKSVRLSDGSSLAYDRLVVAAGIDFNWNAIEGLGEASSRLMPHAYKGGEQTRLLKTAVDGVPPGGLFVIASPPAPYRCPPGPYERASMVAQYFKQHNPTAKILIIDAKNSHSKQTLFQRAWDRFYPGMVEWLPADITGGGVRAIKASSMEIVTADEIFKADAASIIPAQRAGRIAIEAGLADDSNWCPVEAHNLASTKAADVHLLGDVIIAGDMPKSASAANSQAKICAKAILADLIGTPRGKANFSSACWSFVATDNTIKVGGNYAATSNAIRRTDGFASALDESDEKRANSSREARSWYAAMTQEVFQ